jgi:DNA polymerase (family 10)/putative hydrolase
MPDADKRWKRYHAALDLGDWHVHSAWSNDAQGAIADYCRRAHANGLKLIAFTEHVRRKIEFDYHKFCADVEAARREFPDLIILKGCEAKVLNVAGEIDAPDHVLEQCDVVIGSFHSFADPSQYVSALCNMLRHPQVDIWGHPTLYAVKQGITLDQATQEHVIDLCIEHEVLIEFNQKYRLPSAAMRDLVRRRRATHVFGSDAHRVEDLWNGTEGV